LLVKKVIYNQA